MPSDSITLAGLDLPVRIGVPDAERANWQCLKADIVICPNREFSSMEDDLSATVDYDALAASVRKFAAERPRKLLETLASELADHLLGAFAVSSVEIELRKRVLSGVDYTAVRLKRARRA
jgi:7,8-dihydroneopterin aldolase/epimerase/oxygenase